MKNGQMVGDGREDGDNRILSCLSLQIYFFIGFQKRHEVTEVNNCQLDDTNG